MPSARSRLPGLPRPLDVLVVLGDVALDRAVRHEPTRAGTAALASVAVGALVNRTDLAGLAHRLRGAGVGAS